VIAIQNQKCEVARGFFSYVLSWMRCNNAPVLTRVMPPAFFLAAFLCSLPGFAADPDGFVLSSDTRTSKSQSAPAARNRPIVLAARTDQPPTLDGRLDDPCWQSAESTGHFFVGGGAVASQQTRVLVCFDDRHIYVAFRCAEDAMKHVRSERHPPNSGERAVWSSDCVEAFLDPQFNQEQSHCYQFMSDLLGQTWDARCYSDQPDLDLVEIVAISKIAREASWNSGFRAVAESFPDHWVVELAIPSKSVGVEKIADGAVWGANFCRNRPHREYSSWLSGLGDAAQSQNFGMLIFGNGPVELREALFGAHRFGRNSASIQVKSNRREKASFLLDIEASGLSGKKTRTRQTITLQPLEERRLQAEYEVVDRSGEGQVSIMLRDPADEAVLAERTSSFSIPLPFQCDVEQKSLFLAQGELGVRMNVRLGDISAKTLRTEFELSDHATRLRSGWLRGELSGETQVRLNLSGLKEGLYVLTFRLLDETGQVLAVAREEVSKVKGPFDD